MKYDLMEIQYNQKKYKVEDILQLVKESLKKRKIVLSKTKELKIYFVTDTNTIYYTCIYHSEFMEGHIYLG